MQETAVGQPILSYSGHDVPVASMILFAEMNRLPELRVKLALRRDGNQLPKVGIKCTLTYASSTSGKAQEQRAIGSIRTWYVSSVNQLQGSDDTMHVFLQLTAVQGQNRTLRAYVNGEGPMAQDIVQQLCDRFSGSRLISTGGQLATIPLDTAVSIGETLEQFLNRIAGGINRWFCLKNHANNAQDALSLTWLEKLEEGTPLTVQNSIVINTESHSEGELVEYFGFIRNRPDVEISEEISEQGNFCCEHLNPLPLESDSHRRISDETETKTINSFIVSDSLELLDAWPGCALEGSRIRGNIAHSVIHVFDTNGVDRVRDDLLRCLPGIQPDDEAALLPFSRFGQFAAIVTSGKSGCRWLESRRNVRGHGMADTFDRISQRMGVLPGTSRPRDTPAGLLAVPATVASWHAAAKHAAATCDDGTVGHTSEIRVSFDWDTKTTIRLPYLHTMNGQEGVTFFPPTAGDRVLVLLQDLWPIAAIGAWQYRNIVLPECLDTANNATQLGAPRGMVVKGGVLLRSLIDAHGVPGDVVIHSAGNLVLRAEGNVVIDSLNTWQRERHS